VRNDAGIDELQALKAQGVVGVAWNVTFYGVEHYDDAQPLLDRLAQLDLFVDVQVEHDQLVRMLPMLAASDARVLIDHCGRPTVEAGLDQPGFEAVLALGATERAFVKLSGFVKYARTPAPYPDVWPYVNALVDAYTLDRCLWASDWPYLRAPERVDYGVLLDVTMQLFPDAARRRKLFWETPRALFGFA
jgi:predicted TIM-barrel fold metal-dependent hydrolase